MPKLSPATAMDAAHTIRQSLSEVAALRARMVASVPLQSALLAVKQFQARRFAGTYQDLLRNTAFAAPTRFFLEELYGDRDFSDRDSQFARIAGALQTFFPSQVVATAVAMAQLHALTEKLDAEMALQCLLADDKNGAITLDSARYLDCWRSVASPAMRLGQLQSVLDMGHELDGLTRTRGLRLTLHMMRRPAKAAGLHSLQAFLETGFDTFANMGGKGQEARAFLNTIRERESAWIDTLFHGPRVACETALDTCLGKAL